MKSWSPGTVVAAVLIKNSMIVLYVSAVRDKRVKGHISSALPHSTVHQFSHFVLLAHLLHNCHETID